MAVTTTPPSVEAAAARVETAARRSSRYACKWIYDPRSDLLISFGWVPLFVGALLAVSRQGTTDLLPALVAFALFASALHQPLTLGLVYGDRDQHAAHRALFRWAPIVVISVVLAATWIAPLVIIPVAAVWNTVHTLQQRYGLARIYSRKSGYGSARLDRAVLYGALGAAIAVVASRPGLVDLVERADLGGRNGSAVRGLASFQATASVLIVPAVVLALILIAAWVVVEVRAGHGANPARWLYMASSLVLIATIAVAPAAGFVAYLGAHTIEYLVVVHRTAVKRGGDPATHGALARTEGRSGLVVFAMVAVMFPVALAHVVLPLRALSVALACVGALHFLYDGVIWKLRRPAVAEQFAIARS